MTDRLRFHPLVVDDLRQAIDWFDDISIELGNRFRHLVNSRFDEIEARPRFFATAFEDVRFALVPRFPYLILFRELSTAVEVIGVFESASDPKKWRKLAAT